MKNKNKMGTIIHGIFASEHLDSSGEVLDIEGMDISSLGTADSIFNFEHNSKDNPIQVVGKVTFAKKIFKKSDCSNKIEEKFWDFCQKPFVYGKGELFDHPDLDHDGARNVAAILRYDNRDKGAKARRLISFSIEGGKMAKEGMVVRKSIARDVAITIKHCNKMCIAEILDDIKDRNELYKKEVEFYEEKLVKSSNYKNTILSGVKKKLASANDFKEEAEKIKDSHSFKEKENTAKKIANASTKPSMPKPNAAKPKRQFTPGNAPSTLKVGDRINYSKPKRTTGSDIYNNPDTWKAENSMRKALIAGMMGGSPDSKTGTAALANEEIVGKTYKVTKGLKKNRPSMSFKQMGIENRPDMQVKQIDPNKTYTKPSGEKVGQLDIEQKKLENKYVQGQKEQAQASKLSDFDKESIDYIQDRKKEVGSSVKDDNFRGVNIYDQEGKVNEAYDFSGSQSKEEMKRTKGRGNFPSTKQHEGLHRTFSELSQKTSPEHSKSVVNHILDNFFGKDNIKSVSDYVSLKYDNKDPHLKEEHLTHILDLITNPEKREEHNKHYLDGKVSNIDYSDLKRGWKRAVTFSKQLDRNKINEIHSNYKKQKRKPGKVKVEKVPPGFSGLK